MKIFTRDDVNIANTITAIGILLTAWFITFVFGGSKDYPLIFSLSVLIGISDWLDGWLARRWDIVTSLGSDLDKLRDKAYACSAFYFFLNELWHLPEQSLLYLIKGLIILILVIEALLVTTWIIGKIKVLPTQSHRDGKIKAAIYFGTISWWFFLRCLEGPLKFDIGKSLYPLFSISLLLSLGSIYGIRSFYGYLQRYNSLEQKRKVTNAS